MDERARSTLLREVAGTYARVALDNVRREYPTFVFYVATGPGQRPGPRDLHPAFHGSFDWHSCVAMHWLLVCLLRAAPESVPQDEVSAALAADDADPLPVSYVACPPRW